MNSKQLANEVYEILRYHLGELRQVDRHNPDSPCLYLASTIIQKEPPEYRLLVEAEAELSKSNNFLFVPGTHRPEEQPLFQAVRRAKELVGSGMVETMGLTHLLPVLALWAFYPSSLNTLRAKIVCSEPAHKSLFLVAIGQLENCRPYALTHLEDSELELAVWNLEEYLKAHEEKVNRMNPIQPSRFETKEVKPGILSRTIYIPVDSDAELWKMCQARGAVGKMPSTQAMVNYLLEKAGPNSWEC